MIVLWILGILLALIVVILLLRVGVCIRMDDALHVSACIGPAKLRLYPRVQREKKEKKPRKEKKPAEAAEKPKEKKKLGLTFEDVRSAVPVLFDSLKRGLRKTRKRMLIRPLELSVVFGGDDPVKLAQMYGWSSNVMWTVMPQLEELLRMPDPRIHLEVDFNAAKTRVSGELGLSFQIRDFFAIAFSFAGPVLKWFLAFRKAKKVRDAAAARETADAAVENKNENQKCS